MPWISETDSIVGVCMNIKECCLYMFWVKDLSTSATSHGTGRFCRLSIGTFFIITTFTGIFCNPLAILFGLPLVALLDYPGCRVLAYGRQCRRRKFTGCGRLHCRCRKFTGCGRLHCRCRKFTGCGRLHCRRRRRPSLGIAGATSHGTGRFCRLSVAIFFVTAVKGVFCNPLAIVLGPFLV